MKRLRIRKFTMLSLFFILTVPWIFFVAAQFIQTGTFSIGKNQPYDQRRQEDVTETIRLIEAGTDNWTSPIWQNRLQAQLQAANLDAVIMDSASQEIYRSSPGRPSALLSTESFSIMEDGQVLGRVVLYLPNSKAVSLLAAFAGLLLAFFVIGIEMQKAIITPLDRMSIAARQIADGDWEVRLPSSRITEIAEVRDGFSVMVEGLQKAYRQQTELEEERRFVIAAVAHDLRTPLFALRGYLDGMEQGIAQSPEKWAKYLAVCKEKSAQLDRLVEELFTFAKVEYLEAELNRNTVDFKLIVQRAMDSLNPLARRKHISMILNHSADDFAVVGDQHLLERAISNLLDNAVRHTPSHGEIFIECGRDDHKVTFEVLDTGPGFASEELGRIFEPLYRGEASRNRSTGGAGLGLTIAQKIIRRHGGELIAGNDPNRDKGALVSGWLPSAR